MVHKNIGVYGRVHGVGFRFSARSAARSMGIKGYVKNMPDGSVFIEAEGTEFNIREFIAWCNHGPSHAFVENLNITDGDIKGYSTFDIKI